MNRNNRTDPAVIIYGLYLYFSCRSFRLAAKCLEPIAKISHVAIWKWVQKYSDCADRFRADRRGWLERDIFVDETLIKIDSEEYWLWIAYEPNLGVCLSMNLSRERTIFSFVIGSSSNYVILVAESQSLQMVYSLVQFSLQMVVEATP